MSWTAYGRIQTKEEEQACRSSVARAPPKTATDPRHGGENTPQKRLYTIDSKRLSWRRGESDYYTLMQTLNLFKTLNAQNAQTSAIAVLTHVLHTRNLIAFCSPICDLDASGGFGLPRRMNSPTGNRVCDWKPQLSCPSREPKRGSRDGHFMTAINISSWCSYCWRLKAPMASWSEPTHSRVNVLP